MRLDEVSQVLWFGTMQAHQHCATLYYSVSDIETFNVVLDRVGLVRSQMRPECFKWFYCAEFQRNDLS